MAHDTSERRPRRETISVCIIAGNEEDCIRRCLESVRWADEIVVVDSFSKDRTRDIALEYTDRVYQHRWLGYIGQKVLAKCLARHPWVMFVDADEEVSDELRLDILKAFEAGVPEEVAGFDFPRMVWYLGRWIRHGEWYPDIKLRLFRKDRGECAGTEPHDRIYVNGAVRHFSSPLHHYTYTDISDQIATLNRFSSISAATRHCAGDRPCLFRLIFHPPFRFFRGYVLKRGFLDGVPGLIVAMSVAFGTFVKYAKLWELRLGKHVPGGNGDAGSAR
jgi:glycosyltransferase involved in cell wall biosynthesis